jgi:hypothetical protein
MTIDIESVENVELTDKELWLEIEFIRKTEQSV